MHPPLAPRDPPPPESHQGVHALAARVDVRLVAEATLRLSRRQYPEPPGKFAVSADVETMWYRYRRYLEGQERLADMAYACLTVLEARAGDRRKVAEEYCISSAVLGTLGRLTTEIGDGETARKFNRLKEQRSHTGPEEAWLKAAVQAMIRRTGELASDPKAQRPMLTMNDLPKLT